MNLPLKRINQLTEQLQLTGMTDQVATLAQLEAHEHWDYLHFFEQLLMAELQTRPQRKQVMFTRMPGFPAIKTLDEFDFTFAKSVSKKAGNQLASLAFIERKENLIMLGPSCVGKTHLACARGYKATQARFKTCFVSASVLILQSSTTQRQDKYKDVCNAVC